MTDAATPAGATPPADASAAVSTAPLSVGYRRYAMGLLLAIYIINFLDRQVINILAEPIKNDLGLADWQLGVMSGLAFAVFYTFLGIPIARLAERANRPVIIGSAVAAWSGFTMLCGFAQNFTQLVLCRIGVGVGEAGCTPPAHSLITDSVPKEKRASALAFYSMGTPLGALLGMVMGGIIADAYGWRVAFLMAGAPGLLFAILALTTLREPRNRLSAEVRRVQAGQATFGDTLKLLMTKRTFWLIAFAAAIKAFIGYGHAPFTASFFLRVHGEEVASLADNLNLQSVGFLGLALGLIAGVGGSISSLVGGAIADRYQKHDLRGYVAVPAIAALIGVPVYIVAVSMPTAVGALSVLIINALLAALWYGPVYATAQSIVPPHMRATASAILLFVVNLVGLGLGPVAVGLLSDALSVHADLGPAQGVRWALIISTLFGVLAFVFFWMARKTIREEMES